MQKEVSFVIDLNEKYDIMDALSESDKCVVFKACAKSNGEQVVIRIIYNATAEVLKPLPRICSPYVVQVLDVIQDESDVVVIEKFIKGITLRQYLDDGGTLTVTEIHSIFIQLCQALSAIHREGMIHRDIKPSNIMIHNKSVVLIDFDVARQHDPQKSADTVYMGTKGYAAPEQYGFSQTDRRSDIYSLGVVMQELLGEHFRTVAYKNIIDKCTQFDPKNRYQTADEVLSDLKCFMIETPSIPSVSQTKANRQSIKRACIIIGCISVFLAVVSYFFIAGIYSEQEKDPSSAISSSIPEDTRTLDTFRNAYKEAGIELINEGVPFFRLIGAKDGIIFYIDGRKVAIYEFAREAEQVFQGRRLFANWPTNGRFALETSNERAIEIFNNVSR